MNCLSLHKYPVHKYPVQLLRDRHSGATKQEFRPKTHQMQQQRHHLAMSPIRVQVFDLS
eukprot:COSAG05_NODE_15720_length_363_cov_0.609848_2_plen_58_part_01